MLVRNISVLMTKILLMSEKEPRWSPGADAAERVRHVVLTQTEPQNAGWIATEADVSTNRLCDVLSFLRPQSK